VGFKEFLGNTATVTHLRESVRAGRFPHSLILAGPRGSGKYTLILIGLAILLHGPGLPAQLPEPTQNPAPQSAQSQPLSVERWFVGDWICKGIQHPSSNAPAVKFIDKFRFRMALGGSWLIYRLYQLEGPHEGQLTLIGAIAWDANARLHVRRDMNVGGSRMDMTSPGWEGNKITWTGYTVTGDLKLPTTHIFIAKSKNVTYNTLQITDSDGKPIMWEEESCRKNH
jgi:DNA polymerase III delta prime subunit